jgi:uncharacterized protein YgiM (DUF1202 family)
MRRQLHARLVLGAALLSLASFAGAQTETLVIKRESALRSGPADTYSVVTPLPVQTAITRLPARQGPWMQVQTAAGATGWVHMFDVTTAAQQANTSNSAAGALRGLTSFLNRSSGRSNAPTSPTATVGIRGLGAEDIANAQPNLQALAVVDSQRQDANAARRFAEQAPLLARSVASLPVPAAPSAPAQGQNNPPEGSQ